QRDDISLKRGRARRLIVDESAHLFIEDTQGRRLADVHVEPGARATLRLPPSRDLFVRNPTAGTEVYLAKGGETPVLLSRSQARPSPTGSRGAAQHAFSQLFSAPFGAQAARSFAQRPSNPPEILVLERPSFVERNGSELAFGAVALVSAGASAALYASARQIAQDADSSNALALDQAAANDRIRGRNRASAVFASLAAGATLALLIDVLWPDADEGLEVDARGAAIRF
ncbi:MAG: hypothetical protein AAFQ82_20455, partial [Myxococcota bacterium]